MQKVVGSSPIIRFGQRPCRCGAFGFCGDNGVGYVATPWQRFLFVPVPLWPTGSSAGTAGPMLDTSNEGETG
jgi:hypothetical protein